MLVLKLNAMKKYEYTSFSTFAGADTRMNEMGAKGWRCISIYLQHDNYTRYTFEREIVTEELPF